MKLIRLAVMMASVLTGMTASAAPAPSPWEQPAAAIAGQIADILGPGQAQLTIRNLSTVSNDEVPAIRRLLEEDLKTLGVLASGAESANTVHLTLSENQHERLWVAEVIEGNETRVAMVEVERGAARPMQAGSGLALRKQTMLVTTDVVLAALEIADSLVAVEPEEIVIYTRAAEGWREQKRVGIGQKKPLARDPRGVILSSASGDGFDAAVAGMECSGSYQSSSPAGEWSVRCRESDDQWPVFQSPITPPPITQSATAIQEDASVAPIKAVYNAARDYFTGIVTFGLNVDLPPFYSAAVLPHATGAALLMNGIDGKVQLEENGTLKPMNGARDWGSDFAALHTDCGADTQIVASGSGEAANDSLRAFELPAQEAIPASAPLAMDGTVTAVWTAPDGKSVYAVVRKNANQDLTNQFEVDRVTASCN